MADFSDVQAAVAAEHDVVQSAIALINGIATKIEEAVAANDAGDNSKLADLAASVRADSDALAAAVAANTVPPTP